MAALTLKNIPEELLEKLRLRAERDRRLEEAHRQADAWARLAGSWISDRPVEEEVREIYDRRTEGRDVEV